MLSDMALGKKIGDRIKAAREQIGWSGNELAERSGLFQSAVSKIERGLVDNPGVITMGAIAKALGVTIDELVGEVTLTPRPTTKAAKTDDRVEKLEQQLAAVMKQLESQGSPSKPAASKKKRP